MNALATTAINALSLMGCLDEADQLCALPYLTVIALPTSSFGWGQPVDRQRSRDAGFDHHLTKPLDLAALEPLRSSLLQPTAGASWW